MGPARQLFRSALLRLADLGAGLGPRRLLLRWPLPPTHETLTLPECRRPVEVHIDANGVPHIYAADAGDLFLTLGYCHARDRLWQLELNRRFARGELAELFGPRAVMVDRVLRRLGFRHDAEQEAKKLGEEERTVLSAYAAGVNAYITNHRRPVEFLVLRLRPRPWTIVDSLAFARYMGWTLTANGENELIRWHLAQGLGPERAVALEPGLEVGGASNAWAVSAARSAMGRPLLANDPHLRPRQPPTWYVAHLHGAGYDVAGATMPGAPGVLIGHNEHVAWGITAGFTDGQDLYVERADPQKPHRFAFGNEWYDADVRREEIAVKGSKTPVVEEVVRTRHGPLLNGLLDVPADAPPLAWQSVTEGTPTPLAGILRMNRAKDAVDFRAALRMWTFPALNFVFADSEHIGYQLAGQIPIRAQGDGSAPVPGDRATHEWLGMIPFDELPAATNPRDGILATANARPEPMGQRTIPGDWCDDGRLRRILELLAARDKHTVADFQAMQADVVSLPAQDIARRLTGAARLGLNGPLLRLAHWDGSLAPDSVAASIYEVFRRQLLEKTHADLPAPLRKFVLGQGVHEALSSDPIFLAQGSRKVLADLDALLADGKSDVVVDVLKATFAWLRERLGDDQDSWHWGRLHRVQFKHVLGSVPLLDRLLRLNRGPFPVGGDQDTIAQSGVDPWHPYDAATFTVSYRQIFEVGNWDEGRFILPAGQSGHPGSPHYDDLLASWRAGEYRQLPFSRTAVAKVTCETIRLQPR